MAIAILGRRVLKCALLHHISRGPSALFPEHTKPLSHSTILESVMSFLLNHPIVLLVVSLVILWLVSRLGVYFRSLRSEALSLDETDFNLVLGAVLTLLGLIIGFTFSMAVIRYDQRKNYEEQEANAIGTEYLRIDVVALPEDSRMRALLRDYLDQRIVYYTSNDATLLRKTRARTLQLQSSLWSAVLPATSAQPNAISALVMSGMNDVLNAEGYSEAAWRNRIPIAAWILLLLTATFCNALLGYHAHGKSSLLLSVLPVALAISFFRIADIDSPRSGIIRVHARNLESLAESLRPH